MGKTSARLPASPRRSTEPASDAMRSTSHPTGISCLRPLKDLWPFSHELRSFKVAGGAVEVRPSASMPFSSAPFRTWVAQQHASRLVGSRFATYARTLSSSAGGDSVKVKKLRCVMLNAARLDFDKRINMGRLFAVADVSRHEVSAPSEVCARGAGRIAATRLLP